MRCFPQRLCEKLTRRGFVLFDLLRLRQNGHSSLCCLGYYLLFYGSLAYYLFLLFVCLSLLTGAATTQKERVVLEAMQRFEMRNRSESLVGYGVELRFRNLTAVKQLVYHQKMSYFELGANGNGKLLKNKGVLKSYSFPSSFFMLDITERMQGLVMGPVSLGGNRTIGLTKEGMPSLCVELQYQKPSLNNLTIGKLLTVKKQRLCEPGNNNSRGVKVQLLKLEEVKLYNIDCESKTHCRQLCLEAELLYLEETYLQDKLLTLVTCWQPFFATEICFVVRTDGRTGALIYEGGCFNGLVERYRPLEDLNGVVEFNRTPIFVREPLDPYLAALGEDGEVLQVNSREFWGEFKKTAVALLVCLLVGVLGILGTRVERWRMGRKEIELEGFNQHEMSSATIKL